jgi:hypothetical protein
MQGTATQNTIRCNDDAKQSNEALATTRHATMLTNHMLHWRNTQNQTTTRCLSTNMGQIRVITYHSKKTDCTTSQNTEVLARGGIRRSNWRRGPGGPPQRRLTMPMREREGEQLAVKHHDHHERPTNKTSQTAPQWPDLNNMQNSTGTRHPKCICHILPIRPPCG